MDYNGTADELYKYQWDYIHNPQAGIARWLVDDEEAEAIFETYYVDFTTDKFRDLHEIFKGKTEITYVTPGGRFITLPIAFKPNFTGTFVKSKNKEKVIPRVPDGVLFSFNDASGNYWGAHISVKDGNYYFLGYRKKNGDVYTDEYYTENLSSKLGMSAKVLLGLDPGCDLELYVTTCGVLKEAQTDNKGDDMVPDALAIEPLGEPVYAIHSHNKSCLGELGLEFYSKHAENVTDEDLLNKIFSVAKLIDKCGYNLYNDYKAFANNSNSNYWDEGVWKPEEKYEILEQSLNAYTKGKDELEQLLKQYEDNENKFTIIAWMLVEKYYQSIPVDTRYYILNKLSKNAMYGNPLFGNGQEYLALNLIEYTPNADADQLLQKLLYSDIYEDLCSHIDGDNYMRFMAELTLKWVITHKDILGEVDSDHKKARKLYYWNRVNSTLSGNRYITYKTEYDKGNIDVEFWAGDWVDTWGRPWEIHNDKLDAQDVILLQCSTIPECFFTNAKKNQTLIMPAFLFEAMCSKFDFDKKVDYFETALTVASFFVGIGELGAIAKTWEGASWARKGWIIWQYTSSTADLLLSNDCIKSKVFNDFLRNYPDAEKYWKTISSATNLAGDIEKIIQTSSGYYAFSACWYDYKTSDSFSKLSSEELDFVKLIDEYISSVNSQIEN